MPRSSPGIRTILLILGSPALVIGLIGGITGMLGGLLVPKIMIGLYALDGPEPPSSFNPTAWASKQGFLTGIAVGSGVGLITLLVFLFAPRRAANVRNA